MRRVVLALGLAFGLTVSATAEARNSCTETSESEAVGFAKCRRFGRWDRSGVHLSAELTLGMNIHRVDAGGRGLAICDGGNKCKPIAYGDVTETRWPDLHTTVTTGFARVTWLTVYAFKLGTHMELGGGGGPDQVRGPGATGGATSLMYMTMGVFGGARTSLGHFVLGADFLTGVSSISVDTSWLKIRGVGLVRSDSQSDTRLALQGDVSLVYYLSPGVGVGVRAGADVLHATGDFFGGAVLRLSFEPYEGTRR